MSNEDRLDTEEHQTPEFTNEMASAMATAMVVARLRMAGVLTSARLLHLGPAERAAQPEVDGQSDSHQPEQWQLFVEVKKEKFGRIMASDATSRQAVSLVTSPHGWTLLLIVSVIGDVQQRLLMPLVGPQADAFLESVARGAPLKVAMLSTDAGDSGEVVVSGVAYSRKVVTDMRQRIREIPCDAGQVLDDLVTVAISMTEPDAVPELAAGLGRHDIVVAVCLPDDVASQVAANVERARLKRPLN